jgi:hypothetical protein
MLRQQIFPFIFAQNTQSQADKGPQMEHAIAAAVMLTEFMNLGMAIVTAGNTIIRSGYLDLSVFQPTEFQTLLFVSGLQKTAPSAATVIIGPIGLHVDEILFPHQGLYHKAQILGDGVSVAFAHNLTGILNRELDF